MNPIRAWNRFWFAPTSARPLGAFRIVVGLSTLASLVLLWPDRAEWLSDAGRFRGIESRQLAGPLRLSVLQFVQDPATITAVMVAAMAAAALVTIGWRTRLSAIALYLLVLQIYHRNLMTNSGADILLMVLLFYLMLSPSGAAYSLDARRMARRRGTLAEPLIIPWAQRLIQLQLCLIYFATALIKAGGTTWADGTALHYVVNNAEVRRFDLGLADYPLLINLGTYFGLFIEFALAFLLWFRAARPWVILGGLALHGGIALTINIPIFGELMTACYLTFLGPDELDTLLRALDPRAWLARIRRLGAPALARSPAGGAVSTS